MECFCVTDRAVLNGVMA